MTVRIRFRAFTSGEESSCANDGNSLVPVGTLFGIGRFGAEGGRAGDVPSGAIRLDGSGRALPPLDVAGAFGEGAENARDVLGLGVAGSLAEPVLVAPDLSLQSGPGRDLVSVRRHPLVATALHGDES